MFSLASRDDRSKSFFGRSEDSRESGALDMENLDSIPDQRLGLESRVSAGVSGRRFAALMLFRANCLRRRWSMNINVMSPIMNAPETTSPLIRAVLTTCEWFTGTLIEFPAAVDVHAGVEVLRVWVTVTSDVDRTVAVADCSTGVGMNEGVKAGAKKACVLAAVVVDEVDIVELLVELVAELGTELPANNIRIRKSMKIRLDLPALSGQPGKAHGSTEQQPRNALLLHI